MDTKSCIRITMRLEVSQILMHVTIYMEDNRRRTARKQWCNVEVRIETSVSMSDDKQSRQ